MDNNEKIDIVILWVDGNDPEWIKERNKYIPSKGQDGSVNRFRDWENLQYLFRGIQKFAPWVNKVHFVTCGHYPKWLNLECEKLHFVKHEDFIPKQYLPTFNSRTIDFHLHKIKGISDKFIYFNDDMFLTNYTEPSDFFKKDVPCDCLSERPICASGRNEIFGHTSLNNMELMALHFKRQDVLKKQWKKFLNPKYGMTFFLNILTFLLPFKNFFGITIHHLPIGYLKQSFEELWEQEYECLEETVSHKYRTITDVNQFIFRYWSLLSGKFYPINTERMGHCFSVGRLGERDNEKLYNAIRKKKYKTLCINDVCGEQEFLTVKNKIIEAFESILPEKSDFEI